MSAAGAGGMSFPLICQGNASNINCCLSNWLALAAAKRG
jgi:hypothetical protein